MVMFFLSAAAELVATDDDEMFNNWLCIRLVSGGMLARGTINVDKLNRSTNTLYRSLYVGINLKKN